MKGSPEWNVRKKDGTGEAVSLVSCLHLVPQVAVQWQV